MRRPGRFAAGGALAIAVALAAAACGGDELTRADVEDLPPGDATGDAASGTYELALYTTSCHGTCRLRVGSFVVTVCDVGDLDESTITVTQRDGELVMDTPDLRVNRLRGGIGADGAYEVGGWATQGGGAVEVLVHAAGRVEGDRVAGVARSHSRGAVDGHEVDCASTYEIDGARVGD